MKVPLQILLLLLLLIIIIIIIKKMQPLKCYQQHWDVYVKLDDDDDLPV